MTGTKTKLYLYAIMTGIFLFSALITQKEAEAQSNKDLPLPIQMESKAVQSLRSGRIMLNFDSADIRVVAKLMSELTGKNIVLDDKVKGNITILSSQEVSVNEAWELFKSALRSYGYDVVNMDSFFKIVPRKDGTTERTRFYSEANVHSEDYLVAVVAIKNVDPNHIAAALRGFVTDVGSIVPHSPTKTLLIADDAHNVKRLIKIAQHLDNRQQRAFVKTYTLKYAPSDNVFQSLKDIYKPETKGIQLSNYNINNSIVAFGSLDQLKELEKIIEQLDKRPDNRETRRFRVSYLQHANSEEIAKIISEMLKAGSEVEKRVTPQRPNAAAPPEGEPASRTFISTKVSSDQDTNSLIMYLTDTEYEEVNQLISRLDTPRKQVLVSAVIAEVSLKRLQSTGANWQVVSEDGAGAAFGGGKSLEQIYQTLASGNFILGGIGQDNRVINIGGRKVEFPDVFALISFLNEDNDFNLLSAPRILTLDHKESTINVGSIVPFATGVKFDANGQPIVTYDYKDIGLTLKVTPHVSQGKFVKMEVNQKIQDVTEYIQQNLGAIGYVVPVVSTREIDTNITVGDSQTIIIGGLVSTRTIETIKKVPLLGDIPILGTLFKNQQKEDAKTTLFVFLTPHIIESPQTLVDITEKYQHLIEEELPKKGQKVVIPEETEGREMDR